MSQVSDSYRIGDIVSYKYNGMRGEVTSVEANGNLGVSFPSQNNRDITIDVTLSQSEFELIAGGSHSNKLVSA